MRNRVSGMDQMWTPQIESLGLSDVELVKEWDLSTLVIDSLNSHIIQNVRMRAVRCDPSCKVVFAFCLRV